MVADQLSAEKAGAKPAFLFCFVKSYKPAARLPVLLTR